MNPLLVLPAALLERPLGGRYRVDGVIGAGTFSTVAHGEDLHTGARVAVKILRREPGKHGARFGREIQALRVLRFPGVVRLLDEGATDEFRYLVMEHLDGTPFPGAGADRSWERIAGTVVRLLEILSQVHRAGVIHRDLKPANVLVDATGAPTVLDFGIARLAPTASTLSLGGGLLGTPAYLAPEQLTADAPVDARTDLYALGVMVYEALTGRLPHPEDEVVRLCVARMLHAPTPLRDLAPHVPAAVARVVDALLAPTPSGRPRSARDVIAALGPSLPAISPGELVWLGPRDPIDQVVAAVTAGRSAAIRGHSGMGRTRCLREVERALRARGVPVAWRVPGEEPPHGTVVLADEPHHPESHPFVLTLSPHDSPIPGAVDVPLAPLSRDALVDAFVGPDTLLHLREDGARVLFARTAGMPCRLAAEADAWVREGGAGWVGGRLAVTRESIATRALAPPPAPVIAPTPDLPDVALQELVGWAFLAGPLTVDRLALLREGDVEETAILAERLVHAGWLRRDGDTLEASRPTLPPGRWTRSRWQAAHLRVAATLPPGTPGRLEHLLAADAHALAAAEALVRARAAGSLDEARGAATWGITAARVASETGIERELTDELVKAAEGLGSHPAEDALDAGDLERAAALASVAVVEARARGATVAEARALGVLRAVSYRQGRTDAPDLELIEALDKAGVPPTLSARLALTEAAVAWRAGRYDVAAPLARRAAQAGTDIWPLAAALALLCETPFDPNEASGVLAEADAGHAGIALQTRGLLALSRRVPAAADLSAATRLAAGLDPGRVAEVLSPAEVLAFVRRAAHA